MRQTGGHLSILLSVTRRHHVNRLGLAHMRKFWTRLDRDTAPVLGTGASHTNGRRTVSVRGLGVGQEGWLQGPDSETNTVPSRSNTPWFCIHIHTSNAIWISFI